MRTRRLSPDQLEIVFSAGEEDVDGAGTTLGPESILRAMGVELEPGQGREFIYTDKGQARWSGETHRANTSAYHGLSAGMHKFVEDWILALGETRLSPGVSGKVVVYPHKLVRHYAFENTREEIFFSDKIGALVVLYTTGFRGSFRFAPRFDVRHIWNPGRFPYKVAWRHEKNLLLVANSRLQAASAGACACVGASCSEPLMFSEKTAYFPTTYPQDERRGVMKEAVPYQAGIFKGRLKTGRVAFIFAVGENEEQVRASVHQALFRRQECYVERAIRISRVVDPGVTGTENPRLEHALRWAAASLDALVMNQQGRGMYAGLPWFPNYWSRDSFISLPALLTAGQFEACREILLAALERQSEDFRSPYYGRLPNLVSPGEVHYNTADGTWWFVLAAHAFVRYTGDLELARGILSTIIRAIEGEVKKRMDDFGFSVHGDAETWMDASLDGRPWSARGNRAVEIQVLWYSALLASADLAEWTGERGLAVEWRRRAAGVKENFDREFWDSTRERLLDHLDADGSGDGKIRPNAIFALTVPGDPLLSPAKERKTLDAVLRRLVYRHGVGSLAPEDPEFRPKHIDLKAYPFDQAYHNGDVWVWLSGPVISALVRHGRPEAAWAVFRSLLDQVHGEGAVGTLPELRNAVPPQEGRPNFEGTVTQAWSLAEFLRSFHQDILGLKPRMIERRIEVEPSLPSALASIRVPARFGGITLNGDFRIEDGERRFRFEARGVDDAVTLCLKVRVPGGKRLVVEAGMSSNRSLEFAVSPAGADSWEIRLDGTPVGFHTEETSFDVAKEPALEWANGRVGERAKNRTPATTDSSDSAD